MTILSQAETIRDETEKAANTPERVGDCLVDIANKLSALEQSISDISPTIKSASLSIANNSPSTVLPSGCPDPVAVQMDQVGLSVVKTGSGITVEYHDDGYLYFSGLNALNSYKFDFSFQSYTPILNPSGAYVDYYLGDTDGNVYSTRVASQRPPATNPADEEYPSDPFSVSFNKTLTGITEAALYVQFPAALGGFGSYISHKYINGSVVDLGLAT